MSDPTSSHRSIVALTRVEGDVRAALDRALADAEWTRFVPEGADVALKVNLGWNRFVPGAITSPLVVEALIDAIRSRVGRMAIVEADQALESVEPAFERSGMAALCKRAGVEWINLSREPTETVERHDNVVLKRIEVPRVLRERTLITVPVMKTHAKTRITGALKNQWGCLPTTRHRLHPVLDEALGDLNRIITPALSVMDGTIGLEGNGPKSGRPKVADRILCSGDPVALDTIQALSMGIDPATVPHLVTCARRGVGTNELSRIEVRGLDPVRDAVPFLPATHNLVSLVETTLRASVLRPLVFDTPIFDACLAAARAYYEVWTRRHATRYFRESLAHPVYGAQWRHAHAR